MKKYRLLRDLPGIEAGTIFDVHHRDTQGGADIYAHEGCGVLRPSHATFHERFVSEHPEWFEEIIERWEPKLGDKYYLVRPEGSYCRNENIRDTHHHKYFDFGNCFRTQAQATEAAKRIKQTLMDYHRELSEGR